MTTSAILSATLAIVAAATDPTTPARATAVAAVEGQAPVIDGRDSDPIWKHSVPITGFRQFMPREDSPASMLTEARVAYDGRYLYVFVRANDPPPTASSRRSRVATRRHHRTASTSSSTPSRPEVGLRILGQSGRGEA